MMLTSLSTKMGTSKSLQSTSGTTTPIPARHDRWLDDRAGRELDRPGTPMPMALTSLGERSFAFNIS